MPIVRAYPVGEVSSQPLPNVQLNVPAAGELALFGEVPGQTDRATPSEPSRGIVQSLQERELAKARVRFHVSENSTTNQRILENLDTPFGEFTGLNKSANIWKVLPSNMQSWTVRQVLESGNSMARKLLMQKRFDK